jgi:actin-related protein
LQHELQAILTDESCENLCVIAPKNMSHVAWRGAAQLVMSAEKLQYVTRNEYAQKGPSVCNELADSAYW